MNPGNKSSHLLGWHDPARYWFDAGDEVEDEYDGSAPGVWQGWWASEEGKTLCVYIVPIPEAVSERQPAFRCMCTEYSADSWMELYLTRYRSIHREERHGVEDAHNASESIVE